MNRHFIAGAVLLTVVLGALPAAQASTSTVVPLVILFSPETIPVFFGSEAVVRKQIQLGIQDANAVVALRSGGTAWYHASYVGPTPASLVLGASCGANRAAVIRNAEVAAIRSQSGGALVVVANAIPMGVAGCSHKPISTAPDQMNPLYGVIVQHLGSFWTSHTLAHEITHQNGCSHDELHQQTPIDTIPGEEFGFAQGIILPDGRGDTMSYAVNRVGYLSGRRVRLADGTRLGDADHDCVRAVNETAAIVAAYGEPVNDTASCVEDANTACLLDGRFKVQVQWATATATGMASRTPIDGPAANGGTLFWFFAPGNPEMLVKMVNACSLATGPRFWLFIAATTNQGYGVTVTDTHSGQMKVYTNLLGQAAIPVQDTDAFATCS